MAQIDSDARIRKLSVDDLHDEHCKAFAQALRNVLSSDTAQLTFGQIVDGLPIASVESDHLKGSVVDVYHPVHTKHTELCAGVLDRLQKIWKEHDIKSLRFDSTLVHAYNSTPPGSRAFQTRLIEMIAVTVHQIGVQLFQSEINFHQNDGLMNWVYPEDSDFWHDHETMPPTLFVHPQYCDYNQYPEGVADGVGYWAESRILGGVVLFDRRAPYTSLSPSNILGIDPNAIYFHSDGMHVTYRIYQLLEKQRQDLLQFLLSDITPPTECPIPIHGTRENLNRVDPEEPIIDTGVYRDLWERKGLGPDDVDPRTGDVCQNLDYPTYDEFWEAKKRAAYRRRKFEEETS
ncbi:hypothetical protein F5Y16DRAFT_283364 [Xylariaceae sp. FL0255]|nr:hypothetical protein F5Y16DRAFT_283364 [Xylariaceae sp. FL0255]